MKISFMGASEEFYTILIEFSDTFFLLVHESVTKSFDFGVMKAWAMPRLVFFGGFNSKFLTSIQSFSWGSPTHC